MVKIFFFTFLCCLSPAFAGRFSQEQTAQHLIDLYEKGCFSKTRLEIRMFLHAFEKESAERAKVENDLAVLERFWNLEISGAGFLDTKPIYYALKAGKDVFFTPQLIEKLEKSLQKRQFLPLKPSATAEKNILDQGTEQEVSQFLANEFDRFSPQNPPILAIQDTELKQKAEADLNTIFQDVQAFQECLLTLAHHTEHDYFAWKLSYFDFCRKLEELRMPSLSEALFQRFSFAVKLIYQGENVVSSEKELKFLSESEAVIADLSKLDLNQNQKDINVLPVKRPLFDFINDSGSLKPLLGENSKFLEEGVSHLFNTIVHFKSEHLAQKSSNSKSLYAFLSLMSGGLVPVEELKKDRRILTAEELKQIGIAAYQQLAIFEKNGAELSEEQNEERVQNEINSVLQKIEEMKQARGAQKKSLEDYQLMAFLTALQKELFFVDVQKNIGQESRLFLEEYRSYQRTRHLLSKEQRHVFLDQFFIQSVRFVEDAYYAVTVFSSCNTERQAAKVIWPDNKVAERFFGPEMVHQYPRWWDRAFYFCQILPQNEGQKFLTDRISNLLEEREENAKAEPENALSYLETAFYPQLQELYRYSQALHQAIGITVPFAIQEFLKIMVCKTEATIIVHKNI